MASQPPSNPPTIRFATEEDVSTILSLIHELAAYEHASSSVLATEATLLKTLTFPSNPTSGYAKTLLIFPPSPTSTSSSTDTTQPAASESPDNGEPPCAGFALYFPSYSTWRAAPGIYLEDLFVRPAYRGRGYGTALLKGLAQETKAMGGERLEWSVLKWNEPSIKFYEGVGAMMKSEWVGMRVEGEGVGRMAGEEVRGGKKEDGRE